MRNRARKWDDIEDDPTAGLLNLFDVWIAFAVALLLALVSYLNVPDLARPDSNFTMIVNPGTSKMEVIQKKGEKLEHYRVTAEKMGGEGERLGTAFKLKNGEVVYVPEMPASDKKPPNEDE